MGSDALLVIDIDSADQWADNITGLTKEMKKVALAIENELEVWRKTGKLIIFVIFPEADYEGANYQIKDRGRGCLGCNLVLPDHLASFLKHRHGADFEPVFSKERNDAFSNPNLGKFLRKQGVTKLWLTGYSTWACVLKTAQGAVKHGFEVALIESCIYPQFLKNFDTKENWLNSVSRPGRLMPVAVSPHGPFSLANT